MKKPIYFVLVVLAIAGVFLTGSLYGQRWAMRPPNLASDEKISPMDSTHSAHTVNALMIAPASTMSPKQASLDMYHIVVNIYAKFFGQ